MSIGVELIWGGGDGVEGVDLRVVATGTASVEELDAWTQRAITDERWRPPMRVLIDYRLLDWSQMSSADIGRRGSQLIRDAARIGSSRIAVVMSKPVDFGLVRMEQARTEMVVPFRMEVFTAIEPALEWLRRESA